eukprot:gene1409-1430_t
MRQLPPTARCHLLKHTTILQRLMLILLTLSLAFGGVIVQQMAGLRQTIMQEREAKLKDMVEGAISLIDGFAQQAKAGKLSQEAAQAAALASIRMMRWGGGEYFGVYRTDGLTLAHWNPKNEGINRWDFTDPSGGKPVQEIIRAAQTGTHFFDTLVVRPGGTLEMPKHGYASLYGPWNWVIQSGTFVEDVDDTFNHSLTRLAAIASLILAAALAIGVFLGRGISVPLKRLCDMLDSVSAEQEISIPFTDRRNEIGRVARGMAVLQTRLQENRALRDTAAIAEQQAATSNRTMLHSLASSLEDKVGRIVGSVTQAAATMRETAQGMSGAVGETGERSASVAAAAGQASGNVQTVAAASEELGCSVAEIGRQMMRSQSIARQMETDTKRTDATIKGLAEMTTKAAVSDIGAIAATLQELNGIGTAIAASIEQQGAATQEIARNTARAAEATVAVTDVIGQISAEISLTGSQASGVSASATDVETHAHHLQAEVQDFLGQLRAA